MGPDHGIGDPAHQRGVALRVDALAAYDVADLGVELLDEAVVAVGESRGHRPPSREWLQEVYTPEPGELETADSEGLWISMRGALIAGQDSRGRRLFSEPTLRRRHQRGPGPCPTGRLGATGGGGPNPGVRLVPTGHPQ